MLTDALSAMRRQHPVESQILGFVFSSTGCGLDPSGKPWAGVREGRESHDSKLVASSSERTNGHFARVEIGIEPRSFWHWLTTPYLDERVVWRWVRSGLPGGRRRFLVCRRRTGSDSKDFVVPGAMKISSRGGGTRTTRVLLMCLRLLTVIYCLSCQGRSIPRLLGEAAAAEASF